MDCVHIPSTVWQNALTCMPQLSFLDVKCTLYRHSELSDMMHMVRVAAKTLKELRIEANPVCLSHIAILAMMMEPITVVQSDTLEHVAWTSRVPPPVFNAPLITARIGDISALGCKSRRTLRRLHLTSYRPLGSTPKALRRPCPSYLGFMVLADVEYVCNGLTNPKQVQVCLATLERIVNPALRCCTVHIDLDFFSDEMLVGWGSILPLKDAYALNKLFISTTGMTSDHDALVMTLLGAPTTLATATLLVREGQERAPFFQHYEPHFSFLEEQRHSTVSAKAVAAVHRERPALFLHLQNISVV
jgi:hypothetical protein